MSIKILETYALGPTTTRTTRTTNLLVARGSVVDYSGISAACAIVNAANEQCLGGGGVDGAITAAGGQNLARDRQSLPFFLSTSSRNISDEEDLQDDLWRMEAQVRCPTGSAVITGPGDYDKLKVPFVIHAVGPDYGMYNDFEIADQLLRSAYQSSLDRCRDKQITDVAFSLLSAGVFRGRRRLEDVLRIGVTAIRDWSRETGHGSSSVHNTLNSVTLCGFAEQETNILLDICEAELSK